MPESNRSSKGFHQIPEINASTIVNPNDATVNIPLSQVPSKSGTRSTHRQPTYPEQAMNEKSGLHHRHVGGRRKARKARKGVEGEDDALTRMGVIYNKILNFSFITRYLLYVLPVALIIAVPIIIGATAAQNATLGGVRIVWFFSWVEIVWVSLWGSKIAAKCLPALFQFLCGIVSSGTRKYASVITSLELYFSLSGWALTSLATFLPVMTRNPTQRARKDTAMKDWEHVVQNILAATLISSLILLAAKLLIQLISIGYHRTQFREKIQESKHKIHLLSLLYDASRSLFPAYCSEFAEEDYIINGSLQIGDDKARKSQHHRSGSATPMRLLHNVGRFGDHITSAFGNIAQEVSGKQVFNPNSAHSIVVEALEKNRSSEALAKRLWMSFVVEGKEALYLGDIVEVLGPERQAEAEEAFDVLDRDANGDISLDEMILTVCEFGRERHSIANSLHDVDQAINVLDNLLCTIVFVVCIFVFVAFLNRAFNTTLVTAGTALLSLSFVFAGTAQEVLSSCIFLFVKHPFDVLDRVDVGEDHLVVKHISLLFTVFKHVNTQKLTQVPNSVLNTLWIQNVSRSEAMREQLSIFVSFDTSLEDIQVLKNEMQAFVLDKENSRDFQSDVDVEVIGIAEMNKMELKVNIRHKSNWANETVRAARRSKFMCALVLALRKIPINAPGGGSAALGSADQPSYTVSVSDAQAAASRDAYKSAQDAKRLFPAQKHEAQEPEDPPKSTARGVSTATEPIDPRNSAAPLPLRYRSSPVAESNVLNTLNSRHPAADTANNPSDMIEPTTPKSMAHSTAMTDEMVDFDRSFAMEEVRGLLHRESTRGKRKSPKASTSSARLLPATEHNYPLPQVPKYSAVPSAKIEYTSSPRFEYDPYTYVAPPSNLKSSSSEELKSPTPPAASNRNYAGQQQRTRTPQAESPIIPVTQQYKPVPDLDEQQIPIRPQTAVQLRVTPVKSSSRSTTSSYHPPPPPKDIPPSSSTGARPTQPPLDTSAATIAATQSNNSGQTNVLPGSADALSPVSPNDSTNLLQSRRGASPIRNPFQITALKSQAQGAATTPKAVPQPLSEAGPGPSSATVGGQQRGRANSIAPGPRSEPLRRPPVGREAVMPPPRGDSLRDP